MEVGNRVVFEAEKVGQAPRCGVIVAVRDRMVHVRWDSGEESTVVPSSGALTVQSGPPTTPSI